jgi:hypothetical protein
MVVIAVMAVGLEQYQPAIGQIQTMEVPMEEEEVEGLLQVITQEMLVKTDV